MPTPQRRNTIIIGDIHGRRVWESIVARHPDDRIIIVGDYFDSKENINPWDQILNFRRILEFKRANMRRVILLLGNHDYHYLPMVAECYGGYQDAWAVDIGETLRPAFEKRLFSIVVELGKYLVSHAGLTQTWCRRNDVPFDHPADTVNRMFYARPHVLAFSPGKKREPTGDEPTQGPLWVRPKSLASDSLQGWMQVVGHTQQRELEIERNPIIVDVLGFTTKYICIQPGGELTTKELS